MAEHIKIRPAGGTWSIRAGGAVIGETSNAMELIETDLAPVIYIPRADLAMAFLEPSDSHTHCPAKGDARYFSVVTKSETIRDAAWSYETPGAGFEPIAGHLAFVASEKVAVEQI
ncbi:DUF427 domain-containing protein [Oceaniglobus ichthyenteri]|uniref:DUF427 domain-containing protein n=1 Tax=Oceaniglobus ichthyenteri TaxID=2136177 RepID=UPI000D38F344|nr:DUF427 domain-containing protein [Oceaniglobus ichthyenteri]